MATIPTDVIPHVEEQMDGGARRPASEPAQRGWIFWAGVVLTAVYMVIVALMTLWPVHIDNNAAGGFLHDWLNRGHHEGWLPTWCNYSLVEWFSNVVMFMPGGFMLCLLLRMPLRFWVPWAGMCTSVGIETVQRMMPGRTSSLLDILANSLGAFAGWGLGLAVLMLWKTLRRSS